MSDFLSLAERTSLSADMDMIFDTMSFGRYIVVHKTPQKTLISPSSSSDNQFGFGDNQTEDIYIYTPVTGIFQAMILYRRLMTNTNPLAPEINARLNAEDVRLKVRQDCKDFIVNGKTEKIEADGKTFLIDGNPDRQMFLNSVYYLIPIKQRE